MLNIGLQNGSNGAAARISETFFFSRRFLLARFRIASLMSTPIALLAISLTSFMKRPVPHPMSSSVSLLSRLRLFSTHSYSPALRRLMACHSSSSGLLIPQLSRTSSSMARSGSLSKRNTTFYRSNNSFTPAIFSSISATCRLLARSSFSCETLPASAYFKLVS